MLLLARCHPLDNIPFRKNKEGTRRCSIRFVSSFNMRSDQTFFFQHLHEIQFIVSDDLPDIQVDTLKIQVLESLNIAFINRYCVRDHLFSI